jgi:hypothetical protein
VLRRSWLPLYDGRPRLERYREALTGIVDWAPWPSAVTVTVLVATAVAAASVLAIAARLALAGDDQPPAEPVQQTSSDQVAALS